MKIPDSSIYTVSRLNGDVRRLLEGEFGKILLEAEISNISSPASGHWYLTLKDSKAQIRAAMFKGRNRAVNFAPANGQQVLVKGSIGVYEPRGDYQLIIETMLPAGDGLLAQQYEAIKAKLAAQGLFAAEHKRPLPKVIERIGVITSPTGAAIHDVLQVLNRRDPAIEVIIYPTLVQGQHAENAIINAITTANERQEVDLLLLTRGGGSLEDLWCFNSENLAHTIYNSALPIVSAIGHEVDTTISDYVADLRAPTPSAAAEILSKDALTRAEKLQVVFDRLKQGWQYYQLRQSQQFNKLDHRLHKQEPQRRLQQYEQSFDEMQLKLTLAMTVKIQQFGNEQQSLYQRLVQHSPLNRLELQRNHLDFVSQRLIATMHDKLAKTTTKLHYTAHQLDTVSPLATLSRGYSITLDDNRQLIDSVEKAPLGHRLTTKVKDGNIISEVIKP